MAVEDMSRAAEFSWWGRGGRWRRKTGAVVPLAKMVAEDVVGDGIDGDTVDLNFFVEEALDGDVEGRGGDVVVDRDLEVWQSSCGGVGFVGGGRRRRSVLSLMVLNSAGGGAPIWCRQGPAVPTGAWRSSAMEIDCVDGPWRMRSTAVVDLWVGGDVEISRGVLRWGEAVDGWLSTTAEAWRRNLRKWERR